MSSPFRRLARGRPHSDKNISASMKLVPIRHTQMQSSASLKSLKKFGLLSPLPSCPSVCALSSEDISGVPQPT
ncbi:hypothetical protein CEXT_85521 [Caerostris extrusa]|uniref:Uncharacterized protein n=1 Tax=Caerostris extrusa TaxID=172846 RepID=A0AAV4XF22_CAEEX|nr:hypothetical protein CEXT_85521 [Caerostris extrusa]